MLMQKNTPTMNLLLRRVAAFSYDCLLLIALFFLFTTCMIFFNDGQAIEHWSYKLLLLLIGFLFFDWFWRHGGQTLGMSAWKIQLTSENGASITLKQTTTRYLCGCLTFGFTLLSMFANSKSQALHDRLSKTIIVRYNK